MTCVECDSKVRVVETIDYAGIQYRRRVCNTCGAHFWTEELIVENMDCVRDALACKQMKYYDNKKRRRSQCAMYE